MTDEPKPVAHDDAVDPANQGVSSEAPAEGADDAPAGGPGSPDGGAADSA